MFGGSIREESDPLFFVKMEGRNEKEEWLV